MHRKLLVVAAAAAMAFAALGPPAAAAAELEIGKAQVQEKERLQALSTAKGDVEAAKLAVYHPDADQPAAALLMAAEKRSSADKDRTIDQRKGSADQMRRRTAQAPPEPYPLLL